MSFVARPSVCVLVGMTQARYSVACSVYGDEPTLSARDLAEGITHRASASEQRTCIGAAEQHFSLAGRS